MSEKRIAIIGAGMAGLSCARKLQSAGINPVLFEKSRFIGGRMATRVISDAVQFDHGAQYVRGKSPEFSKIIDFLKSEGAVVHWSPRSNNANFSNEGVVVGAPKMRDFVAPLARDLDIRFSTEIISAQLINEIWTLQTDGEQFEFDYVISVVPAPQAARLFQLDGELGDVEMAPCWALLLAYENVLHLDFDVWRNVSDDLGWIARNSAKPARGRGECWVVHASPKWSRANLERAKEDVAPDLSALFEAAVGTSLPKPISAVAHRWRFAQTIAPLGQPFLRKPHLLVGGDWCLGARVDYAFESGTAIANALIDELAV